MAFIEMIVGFFAIILYLCLILLFLCGGFLFLGIGFLISLITFAPLSSAETAALVQSVRTNDFLSEKSELYLAYKGISYGVNDEQDVIYYTGGDEELIAGLYNGQWAGYVLNVEENYMTYAENGESRTTHAQDEEIIGTDETFIAHALSVVEEIKTVTYDLFDNGEYQSEGTRNRFDGTYEVTLSFTDLSFSFAGRTCNELIFAASLNADMTIMEAEIDISAENFRVELDFIDPSSAIYGENSRKMSYVSYADFYNFNYEAACRHGYEKYERYVAHGIACTEK